MLRDAGSDLSPQTGSQSMLTAKLSAAQLTLLHALQQQQSELAQMYLGALLVLQDNANPDSIPLSAHGVRELMEKLPETLDVPMKAHKERMGDKVQGLYQRWKATFQGSGSVANGEWLGEIDVPLRLLLKALNEFLNWYATHHPRMREEIGRVLRRLDAPGGALPPTVEDANIALWRDMRTFFVDVAHHRLDPEAQEFRRRLGDLELFLLDRLHPRTFEDFRTIDELLEEAAHGG